VIPPHESKRRNVVKRHSASPAQAKTLTADHGTGVRNLIGVILRERYVVVSTLEQA